MFHEAHTCSSISSTVLSCFKYLHEDSTFWWTNRSVSESFLLMPPYHIAPSCSWWFRTIFYSSSCHSSHILKSILHSVTIRNLQIQPNWSYSDFQSIQKPIAYSKRYILYLFPTYTPVFGHFTWTQVAQELCRFMLFSSLWSPS